MTSYVIGDLVRLKVTWRDAAGALVDPTTITCRVKNPAGTVTVYTYALGQVVRESIGVYHYDVDTSALNGTWSYRWEGTGAAVGAEEGDVLVNASKVL